MISDDLKNKIKNIDNNLSKRDIDLDPLGYFIIKIDVIKKKIIAEHYLNNIDREGTAIDPITNQPIECDSTEERKYNKIFQGITAKEVGILITERNDSSLYARISAAFFWVLFNLMTFTCT